MVCKMTIVGVSAGKCEPTHVIAVSRRLASLNNRYDHIAGG